MSTKERVKKIFCNQVQHPLSTDQVKDDAVLQDLPYVDSLVVLNFVSALEQEFKLNFDINKFDKIFATIATVAEYIDEQSEGTSKAPVIDMSTLLTWAAQKYQNKTAIIFEGKDVSYEQLEEQATALAQEFKARGISEGQAVALILPHGVTLMVVIHALFKLKVAVFPLSTSSTSFELKRLFDAEVFGAVVVGSDISDLVQDISNARLVMTVDATSAAPTVTVAKEETSLSPTVRRPKNDSWYALRLLSSGSSGAYKHVLHTSEELFHLFDNLTTAYQLKPGEAMAAVVPPYHLIGFGHIVLAIYAGLPLVLRPMFIPQQFLSDVVQYNVAVLFATPFIFDLMAKSAPDDLKLPGLVHAISSGGPLSDEVYNRFTQKFDAPLHIMYGSTEATIVTAKIDDGKAPGQRVGFPVPGMNVSIVDDSGRKLATGQQGRVVVSGPTVITEYLNNEHANKELFVDGELVVGDIGFIDVMGELHILQRTSPVVNVAGHKVSTEEVEEVLKQHPAIEDALVYATTLDSTEVVSALVIRSDENVSDVQVMAHCRDFLSDYKVPKKIQFVKDFPRNPLGKVVRGDIESFLKKS